MSLRASQDRVLSLQRCCCVLAPALSQSSPGLRVNVSDSFHNSTQIAASLQQTFFWRLQLLVALLRVADEKLIEPWLGQCILRRSMSSRASQVCFPSLQKCCFVLSPVLSYIGSGALAMSFRERRHVEKSRAHGKS